MLLKLFFRLNTFVLKALAAYRLILLKAPLLRYVVRGAQYPLWQRQQHCGGQPNGQCDAINRQRFCLSPMVCFDAGERRSVNYRANNFFNNNCGISCLGQITIGINNLFGENVKLYDHNHEFRSADRLVRNQGFNVGKIIIGDNCWFGSNCIILNNVIVGDNVVVGVNVVVYKSIPANSLIRLESTITVRPLPRPTSSAD